MNKEGLTLMELLVVLVIILILAAGAVLYGSRPLEFAHAKAARATLQTIYAAEREFCIHNGRYTDLPTLLAERYMQDPNDPDQQRWVYDVLPLGGEDLNTCGNFIAQATRIAGPNIGEFIAVDQTGTIDTSGWDP